MKISQILLGTVAVLSVLSTTATAALVIYYPLNESSGNTALDFALDGGAQNAASGLGGADWQTSGGIVGGALQLTPTGQTDVDEAMIFNSGTPILSATPFTISLWMQTTDTLGFNHAAVFLGNSGATDQYFAVGTNATFLPQLVARNPTANNLAGPSSIHDGQWHQITAVYSANNSRQLYVDGLLLNSTTANVNFPTLNRFGIGALTRSNQTDAFRGLLDEVGLFNTAFSAQQAALLNAFPRQDPVGLDDSDFDDALAVFNTQSGSVNTGQWIWEYATGLPGVQGSTGVNGSNPYVVLDGGGNGLSASPVPEPGLPALLAVGSLVLGRRRQRAR